MKFHKLQWLVVYTMLAIILSSCNLGATPVPTQDINAIQTEAFNQVLTQVALASSPTPMPTTTAPPVTVTPLTPPTFASVGGGNSTPFPFNTAQPGLGLTPLASPVPTIAGVVPTITTKNGCNDGTYVREGPPYDGEVLKPGQPYEKQWEIVNTGSCTWDEGYVFVFQPSYSSPGFKGYDIAIKKAEDFTPPQKSLTFVIKLNASNVPGEHIGSWKLKDDAGNYFGPLVFIKYQIGTKTERQATAEADALTATAEAK